MFASLPWNAINDGHLSWDDLEVQRHIAHLDGDCEWYEDKEGFLYIVDPEADDPIHGPDNEVAQAMYDALQAGAAFHRLEEHVEGIAYIHHILRRFHPADGFYHS